MRGRDCIPDWKQMLVSIAILFVLFNALDVILNHDLLASSFLMSLDILGTRWNAIGLLWAVSLFVFSAYYYQKYFLNKYRDKLNEEHEHNILISWLVSCAVAVFAVVTYQLILDETSMLLFVFTRDNPYIALSNYLMITQKWFTYPIMLLGTFIIFTYARKVISIFKFSIIWVASSAIFMLEIGFGIFDLRYLPEDTKAVAYAVTYLPVYLFWALAYVWMWKKEVM